MLVDVVGVVALVVALPSLWLAYRADRQVKDVSRELLTVRRLTEGADAALREISSMAADQSVTLEALDGDPGHRRTRADRGCERRSGSVVGP